jgi:GT2 family glycosyltransferase
VLCGRRVKLGPRASARVDARVVASGGLEGLSFADTQRALLGLRLPSLLARMLHPRPRKLMGVNFSLSRRAFEQVNGYDEEWPGRRGDRDLDLRLQRAGCRFVALVNRAIVYHLHHLERPNSEAIQQRVAEEERSTRVQCRQGLRS